MSDKFNTLKYEVGALLYSPANTDKLLRQIISQRIAPPYSAALCLEDSVADSAVEEAERCLLGTLLKINLISQSTDKYIPNIFVRVRCPEQALSLYKRAGSSFRVVTGFVFPKYTLSNADAYNDAVREINNSCERPVYMMPILESTDILSLTTRISVLSQLKEKIKEMGDLVLNIRVGGNDFCSAFGLRRNTDQTIYDIGVINSCLTDILNVFAQDYVVSAPVWEYFDTGVSDAWKKGLKKELKLDRLNGFIGKTAIHPSQVAVINKGLRVTMSDYKDALSILEWNSDSLGVEKSHSLGRMNEVKCHTKWALKTAALANVYGLIEDKTSEMKKAVDLVSVIR